MKKQYEHKQFACFVQLSFNLNSPSLLFLISSTHKRTVRAKCCLHWNQCQTLVFTLVWLWHPNKSFCWCVINTFYTYYTHACTHTLTFSQNKCTSIAPGQIRGGFFSWDAVRNSKFPFWTRKSPWFVIFFSSFSCFFHNWNFITWY